MITDVTGIIPMRMPYGQDVIVDATIELNMHGELTIKAENIHGAEVLMDILLAGGLVEIGFAYIPKKVST